MRTSNIVLMMLAGAAAKQGVTLYEHAGLNGEGVGWSGRFGPGAHTGDFPNDVVTSYKIDGKCCATFFEDYDYGGQSFSKCGPIDANVPDNWNDVISSMKVECNDSDYGDGENRIDNAAINELRKTEKQYGEDVIKYAEQEQGELSDIAQPKEVEIWEMVPGYIVFSIMWMFMFYPTIQDLVLFAYYSFYDFGSSVDIYVEDHENGWTMFAFIQFGMALGTIAYYIYLLVARYALDYSKIFESMEYFIIFCAVNTVNLLVPLAKYAMIYYESELQEDDCGYFNCFWALDSYVGQINLDVEMYPDVFKVAGLVGNYFIYLLLPWVDDWTHGRLEFFD